MINILYIHQSADLYGSDKTLLFLVTNLDKNIFNPIVVLPKKGPLVEALLDKNIKVIITPVLKLHRKMFTLKYLTSLPFEIKKSIKHILKETQGIKINIVQSNTLAVLLGVFLSRKLKAKHIWHVHEIIVHPKFISNLYPKILNQYSDIVICNSKATRDNLLIRNHKLANKLKVIYNGLDSSEFNSIQNLKLKEKFQYNTNDLVITLVGRINRLKGHLLLLKVFDKYFKDKENLKILFVGSPVLGQENYLEEVNNKIIESKLESKVKILPFHKDLSEIWNITDIAVVPSTEAESFGLVALEAMFSKKPVIGTNLGGLKEIIIDNETGFLFDNKDEIAFKNAIEKLISDPLLRNKFGENGYERAISNFSIDKYIGQFADLYKRL